MVAEDVRSPLEFYGREFNAAGNSAANILASERWVEKNNPEGIVFTILCDRGERYTSILD